MDVVNALFRGFQSSKFCFYVFDKLSNICKPLDFFGVCCCFVSREFSTSKGNESFFSKLFTVVKGNCHTMT